MITKHMAAPTSRWMKLRQEFERVYDLYDKEKFLDLITMAYIAKEVDLELLYKSSKE